MQTGKHGLFGTTRLHYIAYGLQSRRTFLQCRAQPASFIKFIPGVYQYRLGFRRFGVFMAPRDGMFKMRRQFRWFGRFIILFNITAFDPGNRCFHPWPHIPARCNQRDNRLPDRFKGIPPFFRMPGKVGVGTGFCAGGRRVSADSIKTQRCGLFLKCIGDQPWATI